MTGHTSVLLRGQTSPDNATGTVSFDIGPQKTKKRE